MPSSLCALLLSHNRKSLLVVVMIVFFACVAQVNSSPAPQEPHYKNGVHNTRYNHRLKSKVQERRLKEVQLKDAAKLEAELAEEASHMCVLEQDTPPDDIRAELIVGGSPTSVERHYPGIHDFIENEAQHYASDKLAKVREPKLYIYSGDHLLETMDVENMSSEEIVKELAAKGIYQNKKEDPLPSSATSLYERLKEKKNNLKQTKAGERRTKANTMKRS